MQQRPTSIIIGIIVLVAIGAQLCAATTAAPAGNATSESATTPTNSTGSDSAFKQVLEFTKGFFDNVKIIVQYVAKVKDVMMKAFEAVKNALTSKGSGSSSTNATSTPSPNEPLNDSSVEPQAPHHRSTKMAIH